MRKNTLILNPYFSYNFVYNASKILNNIRGILSIENTEIKIGEFKYKLRNMLLTKQNTGDVVDWSDENFMLR